MLAPRSIAGAWLLSLQMTTLFGILLAVGGNVPLAVILALALLMLFIVASNAKDATLGEPLLFSDLALVGELFRHPQFYFSAVSLWQRVLASVAGVALFAVLVWQFDPDPTPHAIGLAVALLAVATLGLTLWSKPYRELAQVPDARADTKRYGLFSTMLIYWLRWRETKDPAPYADAVLGRLPEDGEIPELVVIIQCESFADPVEMFGNARLELPGLARARDIAWQSGGLLVSGFGAYTMRTEYGVMFGREESELGFRQYDPFLTALGETSYALPARLKAAGWRSLFVHPHDMRFYGRDEIMPASGFAELVGQDQFDPPKPGEGRYVTDRDVAVKVLSLAKSAMDPTMIYAVTMENHGPWGPGSKAEVGGVPQDYLELVRRSDAMLATLLDELAAIGRPAMLVFFGDHRPSIPGASTPGGARHTPYVIVRFDADGQPLAAGKRADLTPAELHHVMLDATLGEPLGSAER